MYRIVNSLAFNSLYNSRYVGVRNQLIEKEHFEKHKVVFIMMRLEKRIPFRGMIVGYKIR